MELSEALAALDGLVNREKGDTPTAGNVDGLTTEPVAALLDLLGDPHRSYRCIHITGTNGKGSVARMVSSLLSAHGLVAGTYTSPHLERVNERIRRDGEPIDDEDLAEVIGDVLEMATLAGVAPSYFEALTAGAFSWFAHRGVDVAVVEVGMLGRFDATNVIDADVAVITNVDRDHTDGEGDWRTAIAWEKAGIVKPGSFLVLGEEDPALTHVFAEEARNGMWIRGQDFGVAGEAIAVGGRLVDIFTPGALTEEVFVPLHGRHQADNAALALATVQAFFDRPVDPEVAREAFAAVEVPGRFEVMAHQPLVILDGAHNPPGARAAASTLAEEFEVDGRRILVVGLLADKDPRAMLEALEVSSFDLVVVCPPDSPRATPPEELETILRSMAVQVEVRPTVESAVDRALEVAAPDDVVLVAGSLYVVGAARTHLTP